MDWKSEAKYLIILIVAFLLCFFLPVGTARFDNALMEALYLLKWYAREHVILCLIPAFFIAGAISVFISKDSVLKYLGAKANKVLAYGVASISGTILAVCSCTVLPLFAGIYKRGAGLGPAVSFLYSGPAISILSIVLTARILGAEIGIARAVGAVVFSVVIGLLMQLIFSKEEEERVENGGFLMTGETEERPLWQNFLYFFSMVGILVFANWGKPEDTQGLWFLIYSYKWMITGIFALLFGLILVLVLKIEWWKILLVAIPTFILSLVFPGDPLIPFSLGVIGVSYITSIQEGAGGEWFSTTWEFTKQITPLLLGGVLVSGFLLGRPGYEGIIPSQWVQSAVGGNSFFANLFASMVGAFMYFATLTEVPILQGLLGSGMGKGPALALLLAGPALSLPSMLVINSVMGTKKTVVYVLLVVIMSTITGMIFGNFFH